MPLHSGPYLEFVTPSVTTTPKQLADELSEICIQFSWIVEEVLHPDDDPMGRTLHNWIELVLVDEADRLKMWYRCHLVPPWLTIWPPQYRTNAIRYRRNHEYRNQDDLRAWRQMPEAPIGGFSEATAVQSLRSGGMR